MLPRVLGVAAIVFGCLTLIAGGSVVFDVGTARADHGHYVPFVLWFNFLSGAPYVAAGVALLRDLPWARPLARALAVGLAVTGLGLAAHIANGGAYETETLVAMTVRLLFWIGVSALPRPSAG